MSEKVEGKSEYENQKFNLRQIITKGIVEGLWKG
jgi:hypothetical protein